MPRFEPFPGIRYAPGADLDAVIAPPYDVLSPTDVDQLKARDPHNITWIDVPSGGDDRYEEAGRLLAEWIGEGVLVSDPEPSFTIYRMRFTDATGAHRDLAGVFGGLEVVDLDAGGVLPHERTTPKASTDRLDLTRATAMNMSATWGLSLAHGLTEALAQPGELIASLIVDGVEHIVERVTDPDRIDAIAAIIDSDDVLIADGHHRYAIARRYRDEVRAATGRTDTEAELTLTFVNELVDDQLSIEAIHRLVDGVTIDQLRRDLADFFTVEPAPAPSPDLLTQMVDLGRLVLLAPDGSAEWLIPIPGAFDGVRALDGAWLEHALTNSAASVDYQHGLDEMCAEVSTHAAGVLIRPTSLTEIMRTAREGLLMPPKSTFFTPKLLTGLVIRPTYPL